jgi:hypothetical protein
VNALQIAVRIHNKNVNPKQQLGDVSQLHAASHGFRTGDPLTGTSKHPSNPNPFLNDMENKKPRLFKSNNENNSTT